MKSTYRVRDRRGIRIISLNYGCNIMISKMTGLDTILIAPPQIALVALMLNLTLTIYYIAVGIIISA